MPATCAPAAPRATAIALPMPVDVPVTTARRPRRLKAAGPVGTVAVALSLSRFMSGCLDGLPWRPTLSSVRARGQAWPYDQTHDRGDPRCAARAGAGRVR